MPSCYQNLCSAPIQCTLNNVLEGSCVEKAEDCDISGGVFPFADLDGQCPLDMICCVAGSALESCVLQGNCGSLPLLTVPVLGHEEDGSPPALSDEDERSFCERCDALCILK